MKAARQRINCALAALTERDLEGQAAWGLRLYLESLQNPVDITAAYSQLLEGLDRCNRPAARARLVLLQQALECHGSVLAHLLGQTVSACVSYLHRSAEQLHTEELTRLGAAMLDCVLPSLALDLLEGAAGGHSGRIEQGLPHTADDLVTTLFKPVLQVACK